MNTSTFLIFSVLMVLWTTSNGALFVPNAYSLAGVVPVNGSSVNGNCPSECVGISTKILRCDCLGTGITETGTTGVLIDGTVPTIDPTQRNVWASQLFTVMGGPNMTIGVRFSSENPVSFREVVIYLFHCPAWDIGAESIHIYYSGSFPSFVRIFNSLGSVTLTSDMQDCTSLTRVSIPIQPGTPVSSNYFIEFYNPSRPDLQWVHIGEVMFSDQPVAVPTTMGPTTTPTTMEATTTSEGIQTSPTISTSVANESTTDSTSLSSTTGDTFMPPIITDTTTFTSEDSQTTTPGLPPMTSDTTDQVTSTPDTQSSFPAAVVGALVGVITALLVLLIIGGVVVGCFMKNKRKNYRTEVQQLQDVVLEQNSIKLNSSTKVDSQGTTTTHNNHYQKTQFDIKARTQSSPARVPTQDVTVVNNGVYYSKLEENATRDQALPPVVEEANYTTIPIRPDEVKSDMYDDIKATDHEPDDSQYSTVDNCVQEKEQAIARQHEIDSKSSSESLDKKNRGYSLVMKKDPPIVPKKSPQLYRDLEMEAKSAGEKTAQEDYYTEVDGNFNESNDEAKNPLYASADDLSARNTKEKSTTPTEGVFLGEYSEIERDQLEEDVYTEVDDKSHVAKKHVTTSGPIVLSNAVFEDMEENPNYESTDAARVLAGVARDGDIVYSNPDTLDNECESIYNTVYSEPIRPSMFAKIAELAKKAEMETETDERSDATQPSETEEPEDIYSPIYNLSSSMSSSNVQANLPQFKPENIKKIKTLGTGFFGKVILANTVGLSLKDLRMSDTDDDKTKSIRIAVKQLRLNPSPARREVFDKELKFMSRLNHPNVVCALGACTIGTPFIVMEYMEKGDLNQYLQDFDNIVPGNAPPTHLEISVGTLTYMCTQITCAMKYLASKNFIHRDLATRNCLVGEDSKIKIADFGMSRSLYESHYYVIKGHAILPVRWMARECFYGKFSAKTDVWAFGVTMWEIFTLAKDIPYEDMDDTEVANDASKREGSRKLLEKPEYCPQDVYNVMLMCWEMEPSNRATFDVLHESLSSL